MPNAPELFIAGYGCPDYWYAMRVLLALLLSLLVTLAAQSETVARSELMGTSGMMPCGAPILTVHGKAHPIHAHRCTQCLAAALLADLPKPMCLPCAPVTRSARLAVALKAQTATPMRRTPTARGPPVLTL